MKKPVKDLVDKKWAASMRELLTRPSPEMNTLFTRLLTFNNEHLQSLKSEAARDRFRMGTRYLQDAIKLGWHFGITGTKPQKITLPPGKLLRRVRVLMRVAAEAGQAIGKHQAGELAQVGATSGAAVRGPREGAALKDVQPAYYASAV